MKIKCKRVKKRTELNNGHLDLVKELAKQGSRYGMGHGQDSGVGATMVLGSCLIYKLNVYRYCGHEIPTNLWSF